MKKIDILNSALAESGLTAEAVIKSWYEDNQVSAEFLQQLCPVGGKTTFQDMNFIPSKKFVTPKKVEPGMFYYADGLIFPELIKDNQVSAIVGSVEKNHGLALGLREAELPWSSDYLFVDIPWGLSGKEATSLILRASKDQGIKAEAAQWCAEYAFDGVEAGTMFLPSKVELGEIFVNRLELIKSFSALRVKSVQEYLFHWSSSERDNHIAWNVRPFGSSIANANLKELSKPVRCAIEFKI